MGIYRKVSDKDTISMDLKQRRAEKAAIRRENLRRLIDERFAGKQTKLAAVIDREANYISRCVTGTKNIGEQFARHIEIAIGLHPLWMDQVRDGDRPSAIAEKLPEYADDPSPIEALMHLASPRSRKSLERIAEAAEDGKLTEEDLELLNQIAARFAKKE